MSRQRILSVFSGLLPSIRGSNVLARQCCQALADRGHDVHLCCFARADAPGRKRQEAFTTHTVTPFHLSPRHRSRPHLGRFVSDFKLAIQAMRVAQQTAPDIIHTHHYEGFAAALPAARILRIPIILHAHCLFEEELPTYSKLDPVQNLLKVLGSLIDRELPVRADAVVAVCERLAKALNPWEAHTVPIKVIPPGIAPDEIDAPDAYPRSSTPLIVYTGNTDGYQDIPVLLRAFAICRRSAPEARLRLVCSEIDASLNALIERLGIEPAIETIVTQDHTTVRSHLRQAWVAVCPRGSGTGFPIKILDAMAAARPVIASAGSAKPIMDGITGLVVPNHDPRAMAEAILELIAHPTRGEVMGHRAHDLAVTSYAWPHLASQLETFTTAVIERSAAVKA